MGKRREVVDISYIAILESVIRQTGGNPEKLKGKTMKELMDMLPVLGVAEVEQLKQQVGSDSCGITDHSGRPLPHRSDRPDNQWERCRRVKVKRKKKGNK